MKGRKHDRANAGGRPRKFHEPSRPITVTLPERTLDRLRQLDPDRAHAIVRAAELVTGQGLGQGAEVDVRPVSKDSGLIIIGSCPALERVPCLRLIEVAPNRYLLSLERGVSPEKLEIQLLDLLETLPDAARDRKIIQQLRCRIAQLRRADRVTRAEILFVRL